MLVRALIVLCLVVSSVRADDKVALLALDAQGRFEVYGPVVASEIARTLIAAKIDVVVVLPKMSVPDEAKLIIDGKIATAKAGAIVLSLRLREPKSTEILKDWTATAASLETLDKVATDLSQKMLPMLREKLEALREPPGVGDPVKPPPVRGHPPAPAAPAPRPLLVAIKGAPGASEPLRVALAEAVPSWAAMHRRAPSVIEARSLDPKIATKTVAGSNADRAISFEVLSYKLWAGGDEGQVPLGKARVRVRVVDPGAILFDRVVVTDTIVGEKRMSKEKFVERVAVEVLAILKPHVRRTVPGWP